MGVSRARSRGFRQTTLAAPEHCRKAEIGIAQLAWIVRLLEHSALVASCSRARRRASADTHTPLT